MSIVSSQDQLEEPATGSWSLSGKLHEDEPARHVPIHASPFQVGRRSGLPLSVSSPTVSTLHAELTIEDDRLFVQDLGSTNGTFINGLRVRNRTAVGDGDLIQFADVVFRVCMQSNVQEMQTIHDDAGDRALALIQFDRLMNERAVLPFFQPIVDLSSDQTIGYEILARSRLYGLAEPKAMFHAAAILDTEAELSRLFREEGVKEGQQLNSKMELFLNTHPTELEDDEVLMVSLREMRETCPDQAIALEIHESAITSPNQIRNIRAQLRELNISLAYDDFGAGQARLAELVDVPPDYLKFDLKFMREIEQAPKQRLKMLRDFVHVVRDAGIAPLAEGVETARADQICRELGFNLGQGYFYGRPAVAEKYAEQ